MKKLAVFALILSIALLFVSCDSPSPLNPKDTEPPAETQTNSPVQSNQTETTQKPANPPQCDTESEGTSATENSSALPVEDDAPASYTKIQLLDYLNTLLENYQLNPMAAIPEAMLPNYSANLVNPETLVSDYSNFVSVSKIQTGIGEQWNMVLDNLQQSQIFFNTLSILDTVATGSVAIYNNYLDQNPVNLYQHQFKNGIYTYFIQCTANHLYYVLEYDAEIPVLGNTAIQIVLSMNLNNQVKTVRVQLGDANALLYTIDGNNYSFALKYLGVRQAYFEINKEKNNTYVGHIYEYLTYENTGISSVADFYINSDNVTVVGNKASGLIGFSGAICELYSASTGKMLAYEVQETLSSLTYNTVWPNLKDISGLTSLRYTASEETDNKAVFYVNGSSSVWTNKKYGFSGGLKAASRRYDLEFRTQYFHYYDAESEKYKTVSIDVPMLFVQEEVYESLIADIRSQNNITVSVTLNPGILEKLKSEYASKVSILSEHKNQYTPERIFAYIGEKVSFSR